MENEIKAGDVVILKSDFEKKLKMTVAVKTSNTAICFWINNVEGRKTIDQKELSLILLEKIN